MFQILYLLFIMPMTSVVQGQHFELCIKSPNWCHKYCCYNETSNQEYCCFDKCLSIRHYRFLKNCFPEVLLGDQPKPCNPNFYFGVGCLIFVLIPILVFIIMTLFGCILSTETGLRPRCYEILCPLVEGNHGEYAPGHDEDV